MGATAMIYRDGCRATIAPGAKRNPALNPITESPMPRHDLKYTLLRAASYQGRNSRTHPGTLSLISGNIAFSNVDGKLDIKREHTRRALRILRKDLRHRQITDV